MRASILGTMVNKRMGPALRALLLIWAFEPILAEQRWPLDIWGQMIGGSNGSPSVDTVSRAFATLENLRLIERKHEGRSVVVRPLLEDGSGDAYQRPTAKGAEVGPGYFIIPHDFWTDGLSDSLELPGLAMFLVSLHDTSTDATFQVPLEQMATWYGISERSAERGYGELSKRDVLITHTQWVRDRSMRSKTGLRPLVHRALVAPYSTAARRDLQARTKTELSRRRSGANQPLAEPDVSL